MVRISGCILSQTTLTQTNIMPIFHKIKEFAFYKPTNDCWAPSFDGNLCECRGFVGRVMKNKEEVEALAGNNWWSKITISGNDDYSLELEFHGTRMECIDFWKYWNEKLYGISIVSQKQLKEEFGFSHL